MFSRITIESREHREYIIQFVNTLYKLGFKPEQFIHITYQQLDKWMYSKTKLKDYEPWQ